MESRTISNWPAPTAVIQPAAVEGMVGDSNYVLPTERSKLWFPQNGIFGNSDLSKLNLKGASVQPPLLTKLVPSAISKGEIEGCPRSRV